ncbi:uncharacterized protein LOC111041189 [Myzus persicae]|uniref:uncharacterized protein LOC111041189 n=1 Tax=Myzus persicae TaxID=13164 RepID=UPI000B937BAF|nr:uncharacterized protein LOC111041189 [Myzus persicae]
MNSRGDSKTLTKRSEFTAQAAVHLKRHYRNSPFRIHDDTARPLLDNVNKLGCERLQHIAHKTFPKCNIIQIHRINSPQMYGMYLLRKEEMRLENGGYDAQELVLYHVTAKSRALESLKNGLDWRLTRRAKFGYGVSFSNDVDYGNYYANRSTNEGIRVIVMSTVLMNDSPNQVTEKWDRKNSLIIPPGTADTTVSPNGHVFVKYTDFESYPLFFIYYRWTPELLNESKYFMAIDNNHQRLQLEKTLCQQAANLCIGKSSGHRGVAKAATATSTPTTPARQSRNATKQRRRRRNRAAAKADADATAPQPKPPTPPRQSRNTTKQRQRRRNHAAAKIKKQRAAEADAQASTKQCHRCSSSGQSKMMIEVPIDYYII